MIFYQNAKNPFGDLNNIFTCEFYNWSNNSVIKNNRIKLIILNIQFAVLKLVRQKQYM